MKELSQIKMISLIIFLVVTWGLAWPIFKISLSYTPPILFAGLRTLLGGILLFFLFYSKRKHIAWRENWSIYFISSIFNILILYGVNTVGLMYMPSGLFSVLVYLQPVIVGIFAWLWLGEPMTVLKIIGLIMGFLGVGAVSAGGFSGHIALVGIILALVTAVGWAFGAIYIKKVSHRVDSICLVTMQSIVGGIILTVVGSGTEEWSHIVWNTPYLIGLIYGITLGMAFPWIAYITLVNYGDASKVASYTFLVPLISVLCGTLFLHEPFSIYLLIGLLLIGAGIYLVNRKPLKQLEIR
jgi:drug/metabolite transporter (DMT)-like permease